MGYKTGTLVTATGFVEEYRNDTRKCNINMSQIYTVLIQEAGRWCEDYASDLLIDIESIKYVLDHPDDWEGNKNCRKENGREVAEFLIGFRRNGVDHKEYIEASKQNEHEKYHYYRSIWQLTIMKGECRRVDATLKRVE